jgi:ketosteroid isomerase-like protein
MFSSGFSKIMIIGAVGLASSVSACVQPLGSSAAATNPTRAAGSVEAAVAEFVQAFTTLDEARFDRAWTEDATLFFPMPVPGSGGARFTGKDNVLNVFHRFFASVRKGKPGPDYLNIKPEDVHVQDYGDTAIVTFHLTGDQGIARRTLLMRRDKGVWRVAHMHASNLSLPAAGEQKPASQ